jgi:hypothetical protein
MILPCVMPVASDTWSRGDLIAFWSLIGGLMAVLVAILTLRRGNKNSSVASMIPLNAEIRDMWDEYAASFTSLDFTTSLEFAKLEREIATKLERLMNVLELAAAIEVEGTLSGVSRVLMRDYLSRMLDIIISDDYTNAKVSELLQDDTTFIFIRRFLRKSVPLSAVLPPRWYAYPTVSFMQRARRFFRY